MFFEVDHCTGFRSDHRLKPVITLGKEEGVHAKAKFWCELTPAGC